MLGYDTYQAQNSPATTGEAGKTSHPFQKIFQVAIGINQKIDKLTSLALPVLNETHNTSNFKCQFSNIPFCFFWLLQQLVQALQGTGQLDNES